MTGPRQTTGASGSSSSRLMLMISTPVRLETRLRLAVTGGQALHAEQAGDGRAGDVGVQHAGLKARRRIETASMALVMLLPTPPLPETTPMTFLDTASCVRRLMLRRAR